MAITWLCLGLPILTCMLLGAILAPTDPVLSAPVVSGPLARRMVPNDLRRAINAESGINDGLAQPFVMVPVARLCWAPVVTSPVSAWTEPAGIRIPSARRC